MSFRRTGIDFTTILNDFLEFKNRSRIVSDEDDEGIGKHFEFLRDTGELPIIVGEPAAGGSPEDKAKCAATRGYVDANLGGSESSRAIIIKPPKAWSDANTAFDTIREGDVSGTVIVECGEAHDIRTGDTVTISGSTSYNGTYVVTVGDDDNEFAFEHSWEGDEAGNFIRHYRVGERVWVSDGEEPPTFTYYEATHITLQEPGSSPDWCEMTTTSMYLYNLGSIADDVVVTRVTGEVLSASCVDPAGSDATVEVTVDKGGNDEIEILDNDELDLHVEGEQATRFDIVMRKGEITVDLRPGEAADESGVPNETGEIVIIVWLSKPTMYSSTGD